MVAHERQNPDVGGPRPRNIIGDPRLRDISTMNTEVHGVRVFDTWSEDDLDQSLDHVHVDFPRPMPSAPERRGASPQRRWGGGWLGSLVMMMFGGVLGMGVVGLAMVALLLVGGLVAAGAVIYTVPMVDVVRPAESPRATLPRTGGDEVDADLVVMPDPGFRKPEPKKK
jgi:hypothetical protein